MFRLIKTFLAFIIMVFSPIIIFMLFFAAINISESKEHILENKKEVRNLNIIEF